MHVKARVIIITLIQKSKKKKKGDSHKKRKHYVSACHIITTCSCIDIPGMIHAIMVVNEYKADKRAERKEK
jgi:hypothetical protein